MYKHEAKCIRCDWQGDWVECEVDEGYVCKKCGAIDSLVEIEDDGVSEEDYRSQNPLEKPNE